MSRRARWLKANKSVRLPQNVIWVDTETDQIKISRNVVGHRLRFGYACHQRTYESHKWVKPKWLRFTTKKQFWNWVERCARSHTRLYLFAHNWAFDAPVLGMFDELPARGWTLKRAVVESPPVILKWTRDRASIEVVDTLNWWRVSLKAVGESIGLPKLEMPAPKASRAKWNAYGRRDVEIIREACLKWWAFIDAYDLGGFAPTLAGQSMRAFRHRYMDHPILLDDNIGALELARASYHGGRTEAFTIGKVAGPIHCLDVNSMYPAVMESKSYPTVLRLFTHRISLAELTDYLKRYCVVAKVCLETREPIYAHATKDKLLFPVGRLVATLTTPDLVTAIRMGQVRSVLSAAIYDRAPIFQRFVQELYQLRLQASARGDEVNKWLLKILMNSLYGKFAQSGAVWSEIGESEDATIRTWVEIDADTGIRRSLRQFAGIVQEKSREAESAASHPAIASHVTAYARAQLWQLFLDAGKEHVYYCDTDSIYVDAVGRERLSKQIDPATLGALKVEAVYPWMVFHGPKDYATPDKVVCKGVKSKARWLGHNRMAQEQWSSLAGLIEHQQLHTPLTATVTKTLRRIYGKGTVGAAGRVSPFRLCEW